MQKRVIVYANCQGLVVAKALRRHPDFNGAAVQVFENFKDDPAVLLAVAGGDLILIQMMHGEKFGKRLAAVLAARSPASRVLRFPAMHATQLWPQFFQDHTVKPEPGFKHGRFPWGNRLLLGLARQGGTKDQILDAYLSADLAQKFDLKGLHRVALGSITQLEAECDIRIADIYARSIFERQTFFSPYHAANFIVHAVTGRLLEALGLTALSAGDWPAGDLLRDAELPVHASIAKHFGLRYIRADTTYLSRTGAQVSERAFCAEYIDWALAREAASVELTRGAA